ncbi:cerebellar degeneration-related protein 2 [Puntigrus tetrazona]|uniref:cerebellar degeneration-related protein 2 n=1 Tax=Puntigrus tetrazona TaxID=1606681 RepID=UPI001C89E77A|nr:cerebellar degeneration-related protein 2 [Puntigrus tetrazona]
MLTDIIEGEFDIKEEEPWYDHQDLEHDLHLAAELGKNLLQQNRDLEETLQQMCITNQEQTQEIEYLSKQVDTLRSMNDQHAKLHEQLDSGAQDLERKNQRLVLENRAAQTKIEGLTETAEGLQAQVDELQRDVRKMRLVSAERSRSGDLGLACCEENRQSHKHFSHECSVSSSRSSPKREERDEHRELKRSVHSLQTQLSAERARRETAELEADALARELGRLEPRAALLGVYEERLAQKEAEVQELRLLLRSSQGDAFLPSDDEAGGDGGWGRGLGGRRSLSDERLPSDERHRGVSLLHEVDAQYTALQEKYDTLLRRCQGETSERETGRTQTPGENTQPEYKALFQEIFTFIHKSKEDLKENRNKVE